MNWLQLQVEARVDHTEQISALLEAAGALAVSVQGGDDEALLEPGPGEQPLWQRSTVCGLFDASVDVPLLTARLDQDLEGLSEAPLVVKVLEDQDWINAWRKQAVPREFAGGLWVIPSDAQTPAQARTVLRLDPGLAFGSGAHPTTALCLEWLGQRALGDALVVDYGCGSGILAIAAALLGAERVIAVDYDPQALTATENNARLNGVADRIQVCAPQAVPAVQADCVLANILANALYDLADDLARLARPGAGLALSGILPDQTQRLCQRYANAFKMDPAQIQEDWVLLSGIRTDNQV